MIKMFYITMYTSFSIPIGLTEWCAFYSLVESGLPNKPTLTKMSMLIMFFLKLRLNLFDEDIAYRFRVHPSTVSQNFHRVLDVAAINAAPLIKWPEKEALRLSIPLSFRRNFALLLTVLKYLLSIPQTY